jgi:hypothetical protein
MKHLRHLQLILADLLLSSAHAQTTPCTIEPLIFQVEGENHGTKTWEHSTDGVSSTSARCPPTDTPMIASRNGS